MRPFILPILLCTTVFLVSCGLRQSHRVAATLDDVESYINDRPDSALAVLNLLDSTDKIHSSALRARFSLLHVMALDKCYEDITVPGLFELVPDWYSKHGTADEKMKAFFYKGRILIDSGNLNDAAVAFYRAESFSDEASDAHAKGLLFLAVSNIYNTVYNTEKEKEYIEKGLSVLKQADDPLYYSALGLLALVHHKRKEWHVADSLYRCGVENTASNRSALRVFLSNYARLKLQQPEKEPEGAISLFSRMKKECNTSLSPEEAIAYAYALDLLGKKNESDRIILQLDKMGVDSSPIMMWKSRIAEHRGDMNAAFQYEKEAHLLEKKTIDSVLIDSVTQAIQNETESSLVQVQERLKTGRLSFLLIIMALTLLIVSLLYGRQKRSIMTDRLLMARDAIIREKETALNNAEKIISNLEFEHQISMRSMSDGLQEIKEEKERDMATIAAQEKEINVLSEALQSARDLYMRECLNRLQQVGWLKNVLWDNMETRLSDRNALARLRKELSYIHELDGNGVVLVRRLDKELGGIISQLRKDLKLRGKSKDVLFICGCLLNLDTCLLAEMIGTTTSNVYVKKHRLKKQLSDLVKVNRSYKPLLDIL